MCISRTMKIFCAALPLLCFAVLYADAQAATNGSETNKVGTLSVRQLEARASRMITNAEDLIREGEEERGLNMLEAVPRMYPETQARFSALLALGRHRINKHQIEKALADLRKAEGSDNTDVKAEAMLLQARAYQKAGRSNEAVMQLRRITQDFATSPVANDAYYEIGQIHFDAGRWMRAAEAFKMVGNAVPETGTESGNTLFVEAGQRLFVHVIDRDLAILREIGEEPTVVVKSKSGDSEELKLELFGRVEDGALASVDTTSEPSAPNDGLLTVQGGGEVTVTYVDKTTSTGKQNVKVNVSSQIVSTGIISFMDGAFRQRIKGVFANQPAFIQLRDMDLDVSPQPDKVTVVVIASYKKPAPTAEEIALGADINPDEEDEWIERSKLEVPLIETGNRTGIFQGRFIPVVPKEGELMTGDHLLTVGPEDKVTVEYYDQKHLEGDSPELRSAEVLVLLGGSTEPQSIVANASDATIQARKLLLEAQLLHKWGGIFKDVGLEGHANAKADEGLERIAEILTLATRYSLERSVVENAYAAKWDLQLIQDKLNAAIGTCNALVRLYPDTILADIAFMRIAQARTASNDEKDIREGIQVFRSILRLPSSPNKAEAQFSIAKSLEKLAKITARSGTSPNFTEAYKAYRACAETYPASAFAGESFKNIVNYHLELKDYARAQETLERVQQDYPDSPWMDEMLVRWGVVMHRMGNREGAVQKFSRVLEEYPGGSAAQQATAFLQQLQK